MAYRRSRRLSAAPRAPGSYTPRQDAIFQSFLALCAGVRGDSVATPGATAEAFATYLATGQAPTNTIGEGYASALGKAQADLIRGLVRDPAARAHVEGLADALDALLSAADAAPVVSAATAVVGGVTSAAASAADTLSDLLF